jgi:hypothetical protein
MADHSKHEHGCGCGGKTKARQHVEAEFTLVPARTRANESTCCGDHAGHDHGADLGCCGGSQSKHTETKARTELGARGCCGGHGHD